jgi:hypothetical protein
MCSPRLPHRLRGLRVQRVDVAADSVDVQAAAVRTRARCPTCHQPSRAVHSRYARALQAVPGTDLTLCIKYVPEPRNWGSFNPLYMLMLGLVRLGRGVYRGGPDVDNT